MSKRVYLFNEGSADMRNLLGGKGANLAEMTNIGLPIPNGFTISTEACTDYYNDGKTMRRAQTITMTARPSTRTHRRRSLKRWSGWKECRARNSAIRRIRFWFPFVPVREHPCPA